MYIILLVMRVVISRTCNRFLRCRYCFQIETRVFFSSARSDSNYTTFVEVQYYLPNNYRTELALKNPCNVECAREKICAKYYNRICH